MGDKITDIQIRHWLKAGKPIAKAQGEVAGLTFTLSSSGTAAWVLRYRIGGKQRELTIGRYPEYTIAGAKVAATEARAKIMAGTDVAREKRLGKIGRAGSKSFAELAADYLEKNLPGMAENTRKQRVYHVEKLIGPRIGAIPANEVTGADIVNLLEKVGQKHGPKVAALMKVTINEVVKHGLSRLVIATNPAAGVSVKAICGAGEPRRERLKLTESELRSLMPALGDATTSLAIRIMLATCVRINELMGAEWRHVDLDRGMWTIPTSKTTSKPFVIPLSDAVLGWFGQLQTLSCGSRWVVPGRSGKKPLTDAAIAAAIDRLCDKLPEVRRFTPHDCRSTARSHLAALGVPVLVAERCLNHALGGLVAVYDQHDYLDERRKALQLWADFLTCCESGRDWMPANNVVPIRQAG